MNAPKSVEREMARAISRINSLRDRLWRADLPPQERKELEAVVDRWRVRLARILSWDAGLDKNT